MSSSLDGTGVTFNDGSRFYTATPSLSAVTSITGTQTTITGIPSWARRVTLLFDGVSSSGSDNYLIQLGTSGGIVTSGYRSNISVTASTSSTTVGFFVAGNLGSASTISGMVTIATSGSNVWVESGQLSNDATGTYMSSTIGRVSLGGVLDRIRITTINAFDTYDGGTVTLMYE